LTDEQKDIISQIKKGKNIFFTGSAGTGKSFLLHQIIKELRRKYKEDEIAITARLGHILESSFGNILFYFVVQDLLLSILEDKRFILGLE